MNLPKPIIMTVFGILNNEYNLQEMFQTLPVDNDIVFPNNKRESRQFLKTLPNNKIISLKYHEEKPNELEKTLFTMMSRLQANSNYLEIKFPCKEVKLTKSKVMITGCKSLNEVLETLDELKLEVNIICEKIVIYKYDLFIKVGDLEIIRHFSGLPDFIVEQRRTSCYLKYKKTSFLIQNDYKVIQSSRCTKEATEAYNEFLRELNAI